MTGWLEASQTIGRMVNGIYYIYFLSCSEMNGSVQFALKMRWRPSNILSGSLIDISMCVDILVCEIFGNLHSFQALKEDQSWDHFENVCHHCQWSSPPRAVEQRHFIMADGGHVTRDTRDHCCVRGPQWEYDNLIKWSTMSRSISNWIVNCATYNLVHTSRGIKWISVKLLNTTY